MDFTSHLIDSDYKVTRKVELTCEQVIIQQTSGMLHDTRSREIENMSFGVMAVIRVPYAAMLMELIVVDLYTVGVPYRVHHQSNNKLGIYIMGNKF